MRFYRKILMLCFSFLFFACGAAEQKPSTPLETLETYIKAVKRKDTTTMKLLLSDASIKMAEQQAKVQNVTLDEIVKNEMLFTENQKTVEYRNQKIEGERATIEVKNSFNSWDTVPFVLEEGVWKIDKQAVANQMIQQNDMDNQKLDEIINQGRQP
jgi:hypothetical protein